MPRQVPPQSEVGPLDTLAAAPPAGRAGHAAVALAEAVAGLGPGWVALEGCLLPAEGAAAAGRIRHALLHPSVGIALLELAPGDTAPDAAGRLARLLDTAGFTRRFGGLPPILHLRLPQRMLPTLGWVIEEQFGRRPALALAGGLAWVDAARQALAGAVLPPPPMVPEDPVGPGGWWQGGRLLAGIWGGLALLVVSGVLVLQLLGPPEPDEDFAALVPPPATLPEPMAEPPATLPGPADPAAGPAWPEGPAEVPGAETPPVELVALPPPEAAASTPGPAQAAPEIALPDRLATEPVASGPVVPEPIIPEPAVTEPVLPEPPGPGSAVAEPATPEPTLPAEPGALAAASLAPTPPTPVAPEPVSPEVAMPGPIAAPAAAPPAPDPGDATAAAPAAVVLPSPDTGPDVAQAEAGSPAPEAMSGVAGGGTPPASTSEAVAAGAAAGIIPRERHRSEPPAIAALPPAPALPPSSPAVAPRPAGPSAAAPLPALVQRADEMLRLGDISAARRLYERAAMAGNGQAALALGRTYDPGFLAIIHARGIQGDRALAITWYRHALALGVGEAREPLARIGPPPGE
jgi:Meckel syndrome type 1 protein